MQEPECQQISTGKTVFELGEVKMGTAYRSILNTLGNRLSKLSIY